MCAWISAETYRQGGAICSIIKVPNGKISSVIIGVITKSDDRAAGVRFVFHEYD